MGSELDFDIAIVGGGLVGASLARALKNQGFKIAIIDKNPHPINSQNNADARALALSISSIDCLKMLGVWQKVSENASAIQTVHVSKKGCFGISKIGASDYQLSALGYVVSADDLNVVLNQMVETLSDLTIFRPEEIIALEKKEQGWAITLNNKIKINAKLLVAADGAESMVRKHQGIDVKVKDYQQTAIVVNVALNQPHQNIAYERFLENGSIAMLPFGQNRVKCVLVVPNDQFEILKAQSDKEFLETIQNQFGHRLGFFTELNKRTFYPLKNICSETLYDDRLVLIGNAANTLHPVAAQGFNLGLRDAATLAEILVEAKKTNQVFSSITALSVYANRRTNDHHAIRYFTDSLAEPHVFQWLGVVASEWVTPFKRMIAERGLGWQQKLPKLCRGVGLT